VTVFVPHDQGIDRRRAWQGPPHGPWRPEHRRL